MVQIGVVFAEFYFKVVTQEYTELTSLYEHIESTLTYRTFYLKIKI